MTDRELRGYGKINIFDRALRNFAGDERARWYISLHPAKPPEETVEVVNACVAGGQLGAFNFTGISRISGTILATAAVSTRRTASSTG
jgi:hypothetical protein